MGAAGRLVVVGDIGATYMRFAVADHDQLRLDHYVQFRCAEFQSVRHGLSAFLKSLNYHPSSVCLAVAGAADGSRIRMSKLPWVVDADEIGTLSGIDDVLLVNGFKALALALPHLSEHDLHRIGGGRRDPMANRAVVRAGTGLGVAGVTCLGDRWVSMTGEGGYATFAAQTRDEFDIFERLRFSRHHVAWEHLLSGPGLTTIYRLLLQINGSHDPSDKVTVDEVLSAAEDGEDVIAAQAVEYFVNWLGRFAGDVALTFGAQGGVYLSGGIPARLVTNLEKNGFRTAFENKGRLSPYLEKVPVFVIRAADAGLRGAAIAYSESLELEEPLLCAVG
ncbi:glucokinase [Ensifer adhaerens]|nr:glucokinase [Ensifer adhaerens]